MSLELMLAGANGGTINVEYSEFEIIESGSGIKHPPSGAKAMRIFALGGGGSGAARISSDGLEAHAHGGQGGSAAISKIQKAETFDYEVGEGGAGTSISDQYTSIYGNRGNSTIIESSSLYLVAAYGDRGSPSARSNGFSYSIASSTGFLTYQGGNAVWYGREATDIFETVLAESGGGGAAGPCGDGGNGGHILDNASLGNIESGWLGFGGRDGSKTSMGGGFLTDSTSDFLSIYPRQRGRGGYAIARRTNYTESSAYLYAPGGGRGLILVEWFF